MDQEQNRENTNVTTRQGPMSLSVHISSLLPPPRGGHWSVEHWLMTGRVERQVYLLRSTAARWSQVTLRQVYLLHSMATRLSQVTLRMAAPAARVVVPGAGVVVVG